MTYKQEILAKLMENTVLRRKVANALGVGEYAITRAIKRGSSSITKIGAVNVLKEELGKTEEELFEVENVSNE